MTLRITVAGRIGIDTDGGAVELVGLGRAGRLALAYLVCERHRPLSHDELAETIWGNDLPQSWNQMVRGLASKVRVVLANVGLDPAQALTSGFGTYQLHLPPDATVDVERAAADVNGATTALTAGKAMEAFRMAADAVTVAGRQFMPGAAGTWVEQRQAELREIHLQGLGVEAKAAMVLGRWADAAAAAEQAIALEPFRESAYMALLQSHAGAGNRGEALRAYERCRSVLAEQLGVSPSAGTEAAYMALLTERRAVLPTAAPPQLPLPPPLVRAPGALLVGRASERERLTSVLQRSQAEGGRLILLSGEAGIGKTALAATAAGEWHDHGARVLYGRCDDELELPYQPFAEALSHVVAHAPLDELAAHVAAQGGELARLAPELARRIPDLTPPTRTDPEADRYRLFEAVVDLLAHAGPTVLVLDDIHWATSTTLQLLRHVLRSTSSVPLVVVAAYRHTEVSNALADTLADLRREAAAIERVRLEGLDTAAVAAFMAALGQGGGNESLSQAEAVQAHTGGNPFFVGELLRHLAETGATYRRHGPWSYYADGNDLGVPEGVQEVVARRLRRLSDAAGRVILWAAVIGAQFDLELLERVADADQDQTLDALEEAVKGNVIVEVDPGSYRFSHALVRDTVHAGLTATRRARFHLAVGEALEAMVDTPEAVRLPALAHHFSEAASAGGANKAADYALAAAGHAVAEAAWEEAIAMLDRGLDAQAIAGRPDTQRRCDLLLLLAETWTRFYNPTATAPIGLRALELARRLDSPERLGAATYWYVRAVGAQRGRDLEGENAAREGARSTLVALGDDAPSWRARILTIVPDALEGQDRETTVRQALTLARQSGDEQAIGVALAGISDLLRGMPQAHEFLAVADELVSTAPPGGWDGWRNGVERRGLARLILGDRDGFEADVAACGRFGAERRFWYFRQRSKMFQATLALLDGRFGDVDAHASDAAQVGPPGMGVEGLGRQRFRLRLEQGDDERALSEACALVEGTPENPIHQSMLAVARSRVDPGRFRASLARFVDEGPPGPMFPERLTVTLAYRTEVAMALDWADAVDQLYDPLLPYEGQVVIGGMGEGCQGAVDRFLGLLADVAGRWDEAGRRFERALAVEEGLRSPPLVARTQYWYGRRLLERGNTGSGLKLVAAARETAERLGMAGLAADARALCGAG